MSQITIKRICAGTDFSECGDHAVAYGAALARTFGAQLHIVHVLQDVDEKLRHGDFTSSGSTVSQFLEALEKGASEYLAKLAAEKEWRDLDVERVYLYGKPAQQLVEYAETNAIDLMVMGTHGRTGLKHVLTGSVTERVLRTSSCPVLAVRQGQQRGFLRTAGMPKLPGVE